MRKHLALALLGYEMVFFIFMYCAVALAVSRPVDWREVLTYALFFSPFGLTLPWFMEVAK